MQTGRDARGRVLVVVRRRDLCIVGRRPVYCGCRVHVATIHGADVLLLLEVLLMLLVRRVVVLAAATTRTGPASSSATSASSAAASSSSAAISSATTARNGHHVDATATATWRTLPSRQMTIVHPAGLGFECSQWLSTMVNSTAGPVSSWWSRREMERRRDGRLLSCVWLATVRDSDRRVAGQGRHVCQLSKCFRWEN